MTTIKKYLEVTNLARKQQNERISDGVKRNWEKRRARKSAETPKET